MRQMAVRAAFDAVVVVFEIAAAFVAQKIQGAVAENTVERIFVRYLVAWKIFAAAVVEKFMAVLHIVKLSPSFISFK